MKIKYILAPALFFLLSISVNAQVSVIVNKSVSNNNISKSRLLDIYSLNTKNWDNGQKVVVIDHKNDNSVKTVFYNYLGKSNADLKKLWMKLQLTGAGFAPEALGSDEDIVRKVSSTPGAIGYVSSSAVSGDVKVVAKID